MSFLVGTSTRKPLVYVQAGADMHVFLRISEDKITLVGSLISSV